MTTKDNKKIKKHISLKAGKQMIMAKLPKIRSKNDILTVFVGH
ncbi:hypothetical protein OENI_950002 [Oenococcus oeni]|nr:hypothetical protein OENI_950002 [Oenococcus oeni]